MGRTRTGFADPSERRNGHPSHQRQPHRLGDDDWTTRKNIGTGKVLERFCDTKLARKKVSRSTGQYWTPLMSTQKDETAAWRLFDKVVIPKPALISFSSP